MTRTHDTHGPVPPRTIAMHGGIVLEDLPFISALSPIFCAGRTCTLCDPYVPHIPTIPWHRDELAIKELAQTHEANIELEHQVDTLKYEFNAFRTNSTYYNLSHLQVDHGVWVFALDVLHTLNRAHSNFQGVFFDDFRALLRENDAVFVRRMGNYIRMMLSMYMFVRVERPVGSSRFVLAYVKCDWVFSLIPRFEQMRLRLSSVPPAVLTNVEHGENKALRLAPMKSMEAGGMPSTGLQRKGAVHRSFRDLSPGYTT